MLRRLLVLGLAITIFASQAIWVTFSPASSLIASELGVRKEAVGMLAITFPTLFLILTIPSGLLLDRNFKKWLTIGVIATGLAGILRLAFPRDYSWLFACQVLAGIGQPFLLNSFAPLASRLYPERKETIVSILSFSMYLGIIYALGTGRWIYKAHGLYGLLLPIALVSLLGLVLYGYASMKIEMPEVKVERSVIAEMREVASIRELWLLGIILGLGVALFDNMSIWLETVLANVELGDVAGPSVALSLILGLAGVAVIPTIITRRSKRTMYIRGVTLFGIIVYGLLAVKTTRLGTLTLIPAIGLLMLPAYPIIMEWISTFYPKRIHGSASGFIGFVSRIFTVALAMVAVVFIGSPHSYFAFLASLTMIALIVSLLLPRDK